MRITALRSFAAVAAALVALCAAPAFAQTFPPSPLVKLALNPVTNKLYVVDEAANSVTAINLADNTSKSITVGARPTYIAVNPSTNRVYVNNANAATLTVIDGATDTALATLPLGTVGPIQVNAATNVIYEVRLTGPGTDEVTFVNGNDHSQYTIATESFQPIAMAVNHVTNKIYVAHYATGDVRVISGAMDGNAHPATVSIGMWSHPFAIAANPATNKVYVLTEDSRGPIGVINGADNSAVFPALAAGHGVGPKAIALNTVTNKVYAAFSGEIVVIDGATNALTYIPLGPTGTGPIEVAVNHATNKIYVATAVGSLVVIDGATNATSTVAIPTGADSLAVNPITNKVHVYGTTLTSMDGVAAAPAANPITTTITPLANNNTSNTSVTFTLNASSSFAPGTPAIRKVYWQLDSKTGAWNTATGTGPYSAAVTGLTPGTHTLYAFATDGQDAPTHTSSASAPLVGAVAAYTFTRGDAGSAELTLTQTAGPNPASAGKDVMFTLTVVNNGPATATGITLVNPIPSGSSFIWTTPNCAIGGNAVTCSLGSLASGAGARVKVVLRPAAAGSLTNAATVTASQADPNSANNSVSTTVTVNTTPVGVAVQRYRLYSDVSKEHHFTTDLNEYNTLGTMGWQKEGAVGKVLNNPGSLNGVSAVPYYRLYDNHTLRHHWTSDPNEYYTLAEFPWWSAEGVDGYIFPTHAVGTIPLYRLLYPFIDSLHHWTIDANEYQTLTTQYGWVGEGGSGYVIP